MRLKAIQLNDVGLLAGLLIKWLCDHGIPRVVAVLALEAAADEMRDPADSDPQGQGPSWAPDARWREVLFGT